MKDVFVATPNFQRFQELYGRLHENQYGVDMAVVLGRAGRGKTTAAERIYSQNTGAVLVRFEEWLSHTGLLREISFAVAGVRHHAAQACFDTLAQGLSGGRRVIIVDEADRMGLKHLNTLRDIHDVCGAPVLLVGEEPIEAKINQERRLKSRVRDILRFDPVAQKDVVVFYKEALGLSMAPEHAAGLSRHAQGDFRLVVKDALAVEQKMKASGLQDITDALVSEVCTNGRRI